MIIVNCYEISDIEEFRPDEKAEYFANKEWWETSLRVSTVYSHYGWKKIKSVLPYKCSPLNSKYSYFAQYTFQHIQHLAFHSRTFTVLLKHQLYALEYFIMILYAILTSNVLQLQHLLDKTSQLIRTWFFFIFSYFIFSKLAPVINSWT